MKKLIFITLLFVFGSTLSVNAQGATLQDLQAQIQALLSQIVQLQAQLNQGQGGTVPPAFCYNFQNSLRLGDSGADVRALQQALKEEGLYFGNITGNFDVGLFQAAASFQEKYQREILSPFGITRGTGFVGRTTKAQLNKLYQCGIPRPTPIPTPNPIPTPSSASTSIDFFIQSVSGVQGNYKPGETITLVIDGTESDGSKATSLEGFNVQVYIFDSGRTKTYQGLNADFDSVAGVWRANLTVPSDQSKTYDLQATLYCSSPLASAACVSNYGGIRGGGKQDVRTYRFNVIQPISQPILPKPVITSITAPAALDDVIHSGERATITGTGLFGVLTIKLGVQEPKIVQVVGTNGHSISFIVPQYLQATHVSITVANSENSISNFYPVKVEVPTSSQPSITILAPTEREVLISATTYTVRWDARGLESGQDISIQQLVPGKNWVELARLPYNTSSYAWSIPRVDKPADVQLFVGAPAQVGWLASDRKTVRIMPAETTQPSVSISVAPSSPASRNIVVGSKDVEVARFLVRASGETITIGSLAMHAFHVPEKSCNFSDLKLFDGITQIGSTVATAVSGPGITCHAAFNNINLGISKSEAKLLILKTSIPSYANTGDTFAFALGSMFVPPTDSGKLVKTSGIPAIASQMTIISTTQPSITVLSPNGGEIWTAGNSHNIRWSGTRCEKTCISSFVLINATDGNIYGLGKRSVGFNDATIEIPSFMQPGLYTLQVTLINNGTRVYDNSNGYITIVSATPSPTPTPNPTPSIRSISVVDYTGDGSLEFSWTSTGADNVVLQIPCHSGVIITNAVTGANFLCGPTDQAFVPNGSISLRFSNSSGNQINTTVAFIPVVGIVGYGTYSKTLNFSIISSTNICDSYGDVNLDGMVNVLDVIFVNQYIASSTILTAEQLLRADVDQDGSVTSTDATYILEFVTGTRSSFPACEK